MGPWVVTRCPHPESGPIGATSRQRPRSSAARHRAATPGGPQPPPLAKTKLVSDRLTVAPSAGPVPSDPSRLDPDRRPPLRAVVHPTDRTGIVDEASWNVKVNSVAKSFR